MTSRPPAAASLRAKLLAIVFFGALVPLGTFGAWQVANTGRSAEAALRARLDSTLAEAANEIGSEWVSERSALLDIGDDTILRSILAGRRRASSGAALSSLRSFPLLRAATQLILVRDSADAVRFAIAADDRGFPILVDASDSLRAGSGAPTNDVFVATVPVRDGIDGSKVGSLQARFRLRALLPQVGGALGGPALITVVDRGTGAAIAPLPLDLSVLRSGRFTWGGERWLSESRLLDDPNLELVAAAGLTSFMRPFDEAARTAGIVLVVVSVAALVFVVLLTRHVTKSLVELADAADAVTAGDLDRQVTARSRDEVGRLAVAFNSMVVSLRNTLGQLSQRQAVVAMGEFASALAHEIRNPLTAIRLNLQLAEERAPESDRVREPVRHALRDIDRLERTVAGALRLARTGTMPMESIALRDVLHAAARTAEPEFRRRGVQQMIDDTDLTVRANPAALEQLFLNLLLNAAEASSRGTVVRTVVAYGADAIRVEVIDAGPGFSPDAMARAFDAFYTTKPEGTGLGLAIAKRIARAHGGDIELATGAHGAIVRVLLPLPNRRHMPIRPEDVRSTHAT